MNAAQVQIGSKLIISERHQATVISIDGDSGEIQWLKNSHRKAGTIETHDLAVISTYIEDPDDIDLEVLRIKEIEVPRLEMIMKG